MIYTLGNTCSCGFQHLCCNPISPRCLPCIKRSQKAENLFITAEIFFRNSWWWQSQCRIKSRIVKVYAWLKLLKKYWLRTVAFSIALVIISDPGTEREGIEDYFFVRILKCFQNDFESVKMDRWPNDWLEPTCVFCRKVPMCTLQFDFGKSATCYCSLWASQKAPSLHPQEGLFCLFWTNAAMFRISQNKIRWVTLYLAFMQNFML